MLLLLLHNIVHVLLLVVAVATTADSSLKQSKHGPRSLGVKPLCAMKVTAGFFAPATDQSIGRSLSKSLCVRTRKMVN